MVETYISKVDDLYPIFPKKMADKIWKLRSNHVKFVDLSNSQKKSFIAIAKLIERNMNPKPKSSEENVEDKLLSVFGLEKKHVTLSGMAGSGKSTLTKFIVEFIKMMGYARWTVACAPNHNARKVLGSYCGLPTITVHKLLKIRPDTYEEEFSFSKQDGESLINTVRILVVDEVSFIDDELFTILMKEVPNDCIIIGLGNIDQLKPIPRKKDGMATPSEFSPFFTDGRFFQLELTEIKRSDSPVTTVAEMIRKEEMAFPTQSYLDKDGDGVHIMPNVQSFINKFFEYVKTPEDLKHNRMVAFSNDHVDFLNMNIRKKLYQTEEIFVKDEILVAQSPLIEKNDDDTESIIFDNGTYLKVTDIKAHTDYIRVSEVPYEIELEVFTLKAIELDVFFEEENDGKEFEFTVIHPDEIPKYNKFMKDYLERLLYMRKNKIGGRLDWRTYHYYKSNKYLEIKYLPACTVHKSQGITVDNVFFYVDFVKNMSDRDFARRLLYVALTRSKFSSFLVY